VGTHTGMLLRGHRFGQSQKASASFRAFYRRDGDSSGLLRGLGSMPSVGSSSSASVTSIAFHPVEPGYFLVGYSDGCVWYVVNLPPLPTIHSLTASTVYSIARHRCVLVHGTKPRSASV